MRVCFDTLCFSSRLRAADEEATGPDRGGRPDQQVIVMAEAAAAASPTSSSSSSSRTSEPSIDELQAIIRVKEERIAYLEDLLCRKVDEVVDEVKDEKIRLLVERLRKMDEELAELRSHLDKFQSVFPFHVNNKVVARLNSVTAVTNAAAAAAAAKPIRKQRTGISAEPQSEATLQELARTKFQVYEKQER